MKIQLSIIFRHQTVEHSRKRKEFLILFFTKKMPILWWLSKRKNNQTLLTVISPTFCLMVQETGSDRLLATINFDRIDSNCLKVLNMEQKRSHCDETEINEKKVKRKRYAYDEYVNFNLKKKQGIHEIFFSMCLPIDHRSHHLKIYQTK